MAHFQQIAVQRIHCKTDAAFYYLKGDLESDTHTKKPGKIDSFPHVLLRWESSLPDDRNCFHPTN